MGVLSDRQIEAEVKIVPFVKEQTNKGVISYGLSSYGYDVRVGYKFGVFTDVSGAVIDPKAFDRKSLHEIDLTPTDSHKWDERPIGERRCVLCRVWENNQFLSTYPRCLPNDKPDHVLIPPNSFALAETVEYLEIPRDTLAIVLGKSTYARCGLIVNCTPLEPEWKGKVTLELSNTTRLPMKVYAGEGIAQVYFLRSDECGTLYESVLKKTNPAEFERVVGWLMPPGCKTSYADRKGRYQDQAGLTLPTVKNGD